MRLADIGLGADALGLHRAALAARVEEIGEAGRALLVGDLERIGHPLGRWQGLIEQPQAALDGRLQLFMGPQCLGEGCCTGALERGLRGVDIGLRACDLTAEVVVDEQGDRGRNPEYRAAEARRGPLPRASPRRRSPAPGLPARRA